MTVATIARDPHDETLRANTHPTDWTNPDPAPRYNLVAIGAGTAGLVAAAGAAGLGAKVALIERDLMGGDCLNVGCVPSKALLRSARAAATVRDAGRFGVKVPNGWQVDFPAVMERMRRLRAGLSPHDSAARFRSLGVDVFLGQATFTSPDTIDVDGKTLRFQRAVIATGARALHPPIPGLTEAGFLTNETVFALTELPNRLAVIGAGPIGCELAQAFARFGSRVSLLGNHSRIMPKEDPEAVDLVAQAMTHDGVELVLDCEVIRVESREAGKVLHVKCRDGMRELLADAILMGVGRAPNVGGLNLDAAGVDYDQKQGVKVDDRLRSSNWRIYACGDVASRYKFTHAADAMARLVIRNALFRGRAKASRLIIPWCTYTDPEVAHVGLYEHEARERNIPHRVFRQDLGRVDRAMLDGEEKGFVKVVVHPRKDKILGATIVAAHAGEMISEVTLAMTGGLGLKSLSATIHPYPTQAEAIKKIGDEYSRTRLTRIAKWLFKKWLSWGRS